MIPLKMQTSIKKTRKNVRKVNNVKKIKIISLGFVSVFLIDLH